MRLKILAVLMVACCVMMAASVRGGGESLLGSKKAGVFFQDDNKWTEVEAAAPSDKTEDAASLPLVVTGKKTVVFEGKSYPVEKEGLYRFIKYPSDVVNLISRKDDNSLVPVLRGLSMLHIHGSRDEHLDDAPNKLKKMPAIVKTCGPTSNLSYTILRKQAGFWPRTVTTVTAGKLTGYDDGHQMLEVYYPAQKKYILVDIDMGYLFQEKGKKEYLSLLEFWRILRASKPYELVKLSTKEIDPSFSIAMYAKMQFGTEEGVKAWYARQVQIVAIDGKGFGWDEASKKRLVEMWGKDALQDQVEWEKKWYKPVE